MARPWWILGGGYTGTAVARALTARPDLADTITITRRDDASARALGDTFNVRGVRADLHDPSSLSVPAGAIVVCTAPPGVDPAGEIAALMSATRDAARLVYLSSTFVYGPGHGRWIDEHRPVAPVSDVGRARALAEAALTAAPLPCVVLRASTIYGPGRSLVDRIRTGTYRVIGDDANHIARIHIVDLVSTIIRAGMSDVTGPVNTADDDPAPIGAVADTVAAWLGLPPPQRGPIIAVTREVAGMPIADRRIDNRRLRRELGVVLRYPTWRDGVEAELASPTPP